MSKLEIVIPTYNRPDAIKYLVEKYNEILDNYDVIISFHDSSTNDLSEKEIKSSPFYQKKIQYVRYDKDMAVDKKTIISLMYAKAEYVFLCGDGWLANIHEIFQSNILDTNKNLYCIYYNQYKLYRKYFKRINADLIDSSYDEFYKANFWYLILYGGSIVKKEIIDKFDLEYLLKKYSSYGFIYPSALLEYCKDDFMTLSLNSLSGHQYKGESGWLKNHFAVKQWTEMLYNSINNIDDSVLNIENKHFILKTTGKRTGFLTFKGLFAFKKSNNFNYKIYKEYKKYDMYCCNKIQLMFLVLIPKWMVIIYCKLIGIIKTILRPIKNSLLKLKGNK